MTGRYTIYYFQYQEDVGCVCMLNYWISCNDEICADNHIYSRFKLKGKCRSEKWEVYLYGDKTIKVERDSQRRRLALGCATDSVHRLMVDIPVAARHGGFQQGVPAMRGG